MNTDTASHVRDYLDTAAPPIPLAAVTGQAPAAGPGGLVVPLRTPGRRRVIAAAAAAAAVAAGITAGVVVTGRNPAAPAGPAVLTAAMIHRVQAASKAALGPAGHMLVSYSQGRPHHVPDSAGSIDFTFSGRDFNAVEKLPAAPGARHQKLTIRLVGGQTYLYGGPGRPPAWTRAGGPSQAGRTFPDPAKILAALQPGAGFARTGSQVVGGVHTTVLRATRLAGIPAGVLSSLRFISLMGPESLASFEVWVDAHGVVRQVSISYNAQSGQGGALVQAETIRFTDIGRPERIQAPAGAAAPAPGS